MNNNENNLRFAIYSRKSKFTEQGDSVENQIEMCKDYISKNFIGISDNNIYVYEDDGFSGKSLKRPQFQKMMNDCNVFKFKYIIVYRLDRISRNIADFSSLIEELNKNNISFVCIKEQFDTGTPMGRAMMYIASVFAQLERETIAERVKDNMHMLAKEGRWLGGNPPLGYSSKEVKIVDKNNNVKKYFCLEQNEDIEIAKLLYSEMLKTASMTKVIEFCYIHKLKTTKKCDFSLSTLRSTLSNPMYCVADKKSLEYFKKLNCNICCTDDECDGKHGFSAYNKYNHDANKRNNYDKWIIAVGKHKGVISSDEWLKVQQILEANSHKSFNNRKVHNSVALLSGILKCRCGAYMRPKRGRNTKKSNYNFCYMCELKEKSKKSRCDCKNINGNVLDALVCNELFNYGIEDSIVNKQIKEISENLQVDTDINVREKIIENEIKKHKQLISNLIKKIATDSSNVISELIQIEVKKYNDELKKLEEELNFLNIQKTKTTDKIENFNQTMNSIKYLFEYFEDLTIVQKRDYLKNIIDKVVWDGENIDIFIKGYNNNGDSDKKQQHSFSELFPLLNSRDSGNAVTETNTSMMFPNVAHMINYIYGSTVEEEMLINVKFKYKDINKLTIGERCFYARIMKGYNIEALSKILNVHYSTIFNYEHNLFDDKKINTRILQAIATACDKDKYFCYTDYLKFKDISDIVIQNYQKSNNLTIEKMAKTIGVSATTIKKWKRKGYSPSFPLYEKYFKDFFYKNFLDNPDYFV